jgi:hypothetical protein
LRFGNFEQYLLYLGDVGGLDRLAKLLGVDHSAA